MLNSPRHRRRHTPLAPDAFSPANSVSAQGGVIPGQSLTVTARCRLSSAVALGLIAGLCSLPTLYVTPAHAATLMPGQDLVVNPGDYPVTEIFTVNGAALQLQPGVTTGRVAINLNGALRMDGARIESAQRLAGLTVINAAADVRQSTIINSLDRALAIAGNVAAGQPASRVSAVDSTLSGATDGASISAGGGLSLVNSTLTGNTAGLRIFAGSVTASAGSVVSGGVNGMVIGQTLSGQPSDAAPSTWRVAIDDATVEGKSGAALLIGPATPSSPSSVLARVDVRNGAALVGGNGNIVEVADGFMLDFTAGGTTLDGNILVADTATAGLTFTDNAILTGIITGPADTTITNGATWNLTGDSSIGDLTLGATGTVKLGDGTAFNTLNVNGDFVGQGGTFVFNSVFGDDSSPSDKVVIAGNSSGTGNIVVNNINGTGAQTGEGIQLISVAGASNAAFVMPGRATTGIYEYLLYKGGVANPNDGAWYLRSTYTGDPCDLNPSLPICAPTDPGTPVDPVAPVIPVDPIDPGTPVDPIPLLRPEPGAYLANQAAAVHMFQQRRHDRGEPAFEHDGAGAWARVGRDQMHTTIAGQVDTRTHTNVLQIGSDLYRWGQSGRGQIGLMLATGEAETQATSRITGYGTRGKVKGDAVGLYGTWVQSAEDSAGLYVDGWLQYGRYDNRVQGNNLPRETYDATTRAASIEAGYGWAFANADRGTWYLQPQAQVTYTGYKGDTLQEVNGTVVEDDRAGGFESRVGVRLFGHDNASGNRVQPFLAVNWLYTERGDAMRFDGERLDARLPTNRYEAQAGAQLRLGQRWSAWGDLRVQRGDSGYKDAGAQLGLRRAW